MAEVLKVERRELRGKRNSRRLRKTGAIPAVLYGHGEENLCLAVPADEIDAMVRHGTRLVDLEGAVREQAFIRDLQWDTWGTHILHVDFTRISAHERVEVDVAIELRGMAPGVKQGGVVEQSLHEARIECEATEVPESLEVNVNQLELGDSITLSQLELPRSGKIVGNPDEVVVQCVVPAEVPEEEEAAEISEVQPEVIGRKAEEAEEETS
jgi:large subunit ribosomal protein L25